MSFTTIPAGDVAPKAPIDDTLMGLVKSDLDDLNTRLSLSNSPFMFEISGPLRRAANNKKPIGPAMLWADLQPSTMRVNLGKGGLSGNLLLDLRKFSNPLSQIISVAHLFEGATQSISQIAPAIATQSIARTTTQIATQSITFAKTSVNVLSIISVGTNLWRYNLSAAPDADWVGASVLLASCTSSGNNGTFTVVEFNQSGYPSIVVSNASGAVQTGAVGTCQVQIMSYNYTNPVSSEFVAGDTAVMASHTTSANNGNLTIFKVNSGGNNIWIQNPTGVVQGTVTGNANNSRWAYVYSSPAPADFVVGETAVMASHTTGGNNGTFPIRAVNSGGNNIVVHNASGVAQAGVAGTANTQRWSYNLASPATNITAGDTLQLESHTNAANNSSVLTAKQVNRSGANNVIVYNPSGVAQASTPGFVRTAKKIVSFASDQSAFYTANISFVDLTGLPDGLYNWSMASDSLSVLAVNQGGGSNFNIVVSVPGGSAVVNPAGFVQNESKSILLSQFSLAMPVVSSHEEWQITGSTTGFVVGVIPANTPIRLVILNVPTGDPKDLTVIVN